MSAETNKIIIQKAANFQEKLAVKTEAERRLFHYNTVLNVTKGIILYNDKKADALKEKLIDFFKEVEDNDFKIKNKLSSSKLHEHLLPIVQHLSRKENYVSSADLHLLTIIGAIFDLGVFYLSNIYFPIFILLFFILGIYRKINARKEGKYAAMFW